MREELRAACAGARAAPGLADPAGVYAEAVIATHEEEAGEEAIDEGDWDEAERRYQAARPSYAACVSPREAVCLMRLGEAALRRDDPAAAQRHATEGVRVLSMLAARGIEEDHIRGSCARVLGDAQAASSLDDDAAKSYELAFDLFQKTGDLFNVGRCLLGLGELARRRSDPATARERFEQARVALARRLEQDRDRALTERPENGDSLPTAKNADPRVLEALKAAALGVGRAKFDIARTDLDEGAIKRAWQGTGDALEDLRAANDVASQAECLALRAVILAKFGDSAGTIRYLREATKLFITVGDEDGARITMAHLMALGADPRSP